METKSGAIGLRLLNPETNSKQALTADVPVEPESQILFLEHPTRLLELAKDHIKVREWPSLKVLSQKKAMGANTSVALINATGDRLIFADDRPDNQKVPVTSTANDLPELGNLTTNTGAYGRPFVSSPTGNLIARTDSFYTDKPALGEMVCLWFVGNDPPRADTAVPHAKEPPSHSGGGQ